MSKLVGTVRRSDLAGGGWTLETDRGERYDLRGAVTGLADGMRAQLEGKVERQLMGIGMTGPSFTVTAVTRLDG